MKDGKHTQPPAWAKRLFIWYCEEVVAEDLVGDMDELFRQNLHTMSLFRARWKYVIQVIVLLFSFGVRNRKNRNRQINGSSSYHSIAMYKSYSKLAVRNLLKQKVFSLINLVCLSVGMSVGLLALSAWMDVLEVDNFQSNAAKIYRVTTKVVDGDENRTYASVSAPLAEKIKAEVPGINEVVRIYRNFNPEIVQSHNTSLSFYGYYVDHNFLNVFSFPLIEGNAQHALDKPFSVIITATAAEKLFRTTSVLGKIIEVKGLGSFEVTGVLQDYPRSHLDFEVLASYATLESLDQQGITISSLQDWGPLTDHYAYVLINDDRSVSKITSVLKTFSIPARDDAKTPTVVFGLQPFTDIPLSDLSNEIGLSWGDLSLYIFFALALLVLLPACFNYANIAIARALKRAKEIGLRKVSGGQSSHIFFQMVMETVILSVLSLSGAILIFMGVRSGFLAMVVNGSRTFDLQITPASFFVFLLFGIFTGFIAGIFPALYFSRLNPIETLRNGSPPGHLSKISIRKGLLVFQFVLSLFFILSVTIIFRQYQYALNFDMGFQKENILDIPLQGVSKNILETELKKIPEVTAVSMSSSVPGNWSISSTWVKGGPVADSLEVYQIFVDRNYISNLELNLLAGTTFPETTPQQEEYIIVNETFLRKFSLSSYPDALAQSFLVDGKQLRIIGVVKDFNYMPLREQIQSFFFRYDPNRFNYANVKLSSSNITESLAKIEESWKKVSTQKFEARFLDDALEDSFGSLKNMMRIFGFLGALAITISCLGLLAVVISAVESRTKEMGIRKIMGATVPELAFGISRIFIKLVALAILIATPATYFIFDKIFLRLNYYRAAIGASELAFGILLLLILISAIIGSQTLKVAKINPVETLKYE